MNNGPDTATAGAASRASLLTTIVNASGVQRITTKAELRQFVESNRFFWLDIVGDKDVERGTFLAELGLTEVDDNWARRFGQTGRMTIAEDSLRAVTWLSEAPDRPTEIHLLGSSKCILTVWNGDASALDEIRAQFAERAQELEKSPYQAAAVVLQLLLGTLDRATSELDVQLQELQGQLKQYPATVDFALLTGRLQRLQSVWSAIDRYNTAVRSAIVGIGTLPGIDQRGAAELNDYADRVDDIEHRFHERYQWGADILQNYATAITKAIAAKVATKKADEGRIGLLNRINALGELAASNAAIAGATVLLGLFVVMVDCLPVLSKMMSGTTKYDKLVEERLRTAEAIAMAGMKVSERQATGRDEVALQTIDSQVRARLEQIDDASRVDKARRDAELDRKIAELAAEYRRSGSW